MFGNRTVQIGLAKKPEVITDDNNYADKITVTSVCVDSAIRKLGLAVAGYVLLDTFRKVMVEKTKKS